MAANVVRGFILMVVKKQYSEHSNRFYFNNSDEVKQRSEHC